MCSVVREFYDTMKHLKTVLSHNKLLFSSKQATAIYNAGGLLGYVTIHGNTSAECL